MNLTMVYTYFEVGKMIVKKEQKGKERAEYGKKIIKGLSVRLTKQLGKGFSQRNLEQMRQFYQAFSIPQTLSAELRKQEDKINFTLSWSHYQVLMRMKDNEERNFYEIEATNENWGIRELKRQFDSALYQRLVLSRDKKGVKELSIIGIILCRDKNDMLVEITLPENNEQIFASKYETILPSKDELKKILNE